MVIVKNTKKEIDKIGKKIKNGNIDSEDYEKI